MVGAPTKVVVARLVEGRVASRREATVTPIASGRDNVPTIVGGRDNVPTIIGSRIVED